MTRTLDTGTDDLLTHVDGGVGVITFNRPDRRNALSNEMYEGFGRVLPLMEVDDEVRVVMVTGAGNAFCAGGDVKGMHESHQPGAAPRRGGTVQSATDGLRTYQRKVSLALHRFPKPVVAAIPGPAAGAGMSIALACDIRLAAERAIIVPAFANVGASGDFGGSWFLTQLVGTAKAKELYFTSPRISSADALQLGPDDSLLELGCGAGGFLAGQADRVQRVAGIDLSDIQVGLARQRLGEQIAAGTAQIVHGDAAALPWPDASFTVVTCMSVFEAFPDPPAVVAEVFRVLRPGGRAVLNIGERVDPGTQTHRILNGTVWVWSEDDVRDMVEHAGFADVTIQYVPWGEDTAANRLFAKLVGPLGRELRLARGVKP